MKHILFTGAAGYIGSHTALAFLQNSDCKITIIDNLQSGFMENVAFLERDFGERIEFIQMDLGDLGAVANLFSKHKFDAVVHFAASLIVPESLTKPLLYYSNNTKNTLNLIAHCVKSGVNRFIFSSTAAVYGEPKIVPVSEDSPLLPINPYGASKMMSEMILRDTAIANADFRFVALRYFNVAGAYRNNDYAKKQGIGQRSANATHLIKVACECAVGKRESMSIFGDDYATKDGSCIRDYIHIDDLANAHLGAYEFLENGGESSVFNVGYGKGYSVKEIVEKVKEISGVDFKVIIAPRRAGDPAELISNNAKILAQTSWRPKFDDIDFIIKSAYLWEKCLKA
ncbi:UDP-glucose 4-epimerase GalE [Helicobacter sp. 23-1045]